MSSLTIPPPRLHDNSPDLLLHEIRWHLEPGPAIDADEPIDLDAIDVSEVTNPLAGPLLAVIKSNRRLLDRLSGATRLIRAMLECLRTRELEISRLERQRRAWLDERKARTR